MVTDRPPRKRELIAQYQASDQLVNIELPGDSRLAMLARAIETAMAGESQAAVRRSCADFLTAAAEFYQVSAPEVRALAARPIRVREGGWASELFGDYTPHTAAIRIWTRTAVRKQVTSYGTFLSTLCHEFCHHLDMRKFGFRGSPHTRGFYERTAALYHHARGTPRKQLAWARMPRGMWRIDWQRMRALEQMQPAEAASRAAQLARNVNIL
jgi:hypothetical protein